MDWGAPSDDDNPVGTVTNVPIGEPLVLLVLALGYVICIRLRMRKAK
jgi:hypothetical protein